MKFKMMAEDTEDCGFAKLGGENVDFAVVLRESDDGSSSLLSVVSDTSSLCGDDLLLGFEMGLETGPGFVDVNNVELIPKDCIGGPLPVAEEMAGAKSSVQSEKRASRSVFEVDCVPLWGFTSVCGRRPEMEDAVAAVPRLLKIPIWMLAGDGAVDGLSSSSCLSHLTGHFFGVYDGHGGKAQIEPIAPETVGSTAVVAVVCSSHIIVANCGDSRVVLCRGKEPVALSVDHKPNREDEYARIEAAGGKIIQWNGHRVFGVLAMSRSIGDRYLKPSIIPDPEVTFTPRAREDECLILASDGLWDVMTNEEVCEIARKRIILWHKNNGPTPFLERGEGVDPAAQAAAQYLSNRALQKGSKDNISVVVVDLKAQRKFKTRS
ncbi:protein phosphatase 2C family protein [Striga asiatica]|uniref:protein-serine/threonine phosphatase n=1 Tax=Striga asiatica TaxID=4170 RepID=A0A5A7R2I0_STRAF|nr:protein phosphatase 2C family protein [Striga asiatica]